MAQTLKNTIKTGEEETLNRAGKKMLSNIS